MPYRDVRQFIARLDAAGELLEIDAEVDPNEELGAVCRKVLDEGGPALLFNNVKDFPYPVFTNMLGTQSRIALAMDVPLEEMAHAFLNRSRTRPWPQPTIRDTAPCKEVVIPEAQLRLEDLVPPAVNNPGDGGAFLNYGLVVMKDPDSGRRNMGIYRLQIRPGNRSGIWSSPTSHAGTIRAKNDIRGRPTEVAVAIGGDPMLYLASQVQGLNLGDDELELASALRGEPIDLIKCDTVDLEVPADAEIVLEGRILYGEREAEGPYGEYPGYYGPIGDQPVIQFHHATRRRQPVYVHTYIGVPPSDTHALGQMMGEAGLTAKLRNDVAPTVKEVYCALDMHTVVVSLKKTYEEQAKHVIYALWATRSAKTVIVVDDDIDPRNQEQVYWAIANRSHAPRDVIMGDGFGTIGPAMDKYGDGIASKLGIDATAPLKGYPAMSRPRPEMAKRVRDRWAELTASQKTKLRRSGGR
jgi:2,5-furandicarboxylate decarboxylase 1